MPNCAHWRSTHAARARAWRSDCGRDELLDWLMGSAVGPQLGADRLCFVHHYPASQAALARLDADDARVALRFELYYHGVELANGFEELADAAEQRARFEPIASSAGAAACMLPDIDVALLAALAAGLPPVSGVALGFDRLLMLRSGASDIERSAAICARARLSGRRAYCLAREM